MSFCSQQLYGGIDVEIEQKGIGLEFLDGDGRDGLVVWIVPQRLQRFNVPKVFGVKADDSGVLHGVGFAQFGQGQPGPTVALTLCPMTLWLSPA